jgi:cytochrome c oxidase cbb3-type subunit 3
LDHDYDGIKELTIIYRHGGCIYSMFIVELYFVRFEIFGGDNQEMELKELAQAKIDGRENGSRFNG